MAGARIEIVKGETNRYRSILHRPDGVTIELDGGSYNQIGGSPGAVPHDFAHYVVEDELDLRHGLWGVLSAGGLVQNARVVSGRQRPNAKQRGEQLVRAKRDELHQCEVLTRLVAGVASGETAPDVARIKRSIGRAWTDRLTRESLDRCAARLRAAADQWSALQPGEALTAAWNLTPAPRDRPTARPARAARRA